MYGSFKAAGLFAVLLSVACTSAPATADTTADTPQLTYRNSPFFMFDSPDSFSANIGLADVDNDGDLDVLVANGRHWAQQDYVYLNAGNGRLLEARPIGDTMGPSYIVLAGDIDGDGDMDAVMIRDVLPAQSFMNDGTGRFSFAGLVEGTGGAARNAILTDLNKDEKGTSLNAICNKLGIDRELLTRWERAEPKSLRLAKQIDQAIEEMP